MATEQPYPASGHEALDWYDAQADKLGEAYEAIEPSILHSWMADLLPLEPGLAIDVGSGIGRDAAWLADLGHAVAGPTRPPALVQSRPRTPASPATFLIN